LVVIRHLYPNDDCKKFGEFQPCIITLISLFSKTFCEYMHCLAHNIVAWDLKKRERCKNEFLPKLSFDVCYHFQFCAIILKWFMYSLTLHCNIVDLCIKRSQVEHCMGKLIEVSSFQLKWPNHKSYLTFFLRHFVNACIASLITLSPKI